MPLHLRPAILADHRVFVRLFPELGVDDALLDEERFGRQLLPTTWMAETDRPDGTRDAVGYVYFQLMKDVAIVRHLVTAPEARRTGVGRALLAKVVELARGAGCTKWSLNVKPGNAPAIALYEATGLRRMHASHSLDLAWTMLDSAPVAAETAVRAQDIVPEDDARVESAMRWADGQLATTRAVSGRVLKSLETTDGSVVGAAVFHPDFPGAYPFRVARPELAVVLLRALRPHARAGDTNLGIVVEGQPEVTDALLDLGARLKLDIVHMAGPLP